MWNTIIIDNSPASFMFHPECALPTISWYDDMNDKELFLFLPILEALSKTKDIWKLLKKFVSRENNTVDFVKAYEILNEN